MLDPSAGLVVVVLAPTGKDGPLIARALVRAGIAAEVVGDVAELCQRCGAAGAVVVAEEALSPAAMSCLADALRRQPPWSDLPLVVMTGGGKTTRYSTRVAERLQSSANVTLLERPLRMLTLVSAVRSALRARRRQYEVRDLLEEARRAVQHRDTFLAMLGHELRNPLAAVRTAAEVINGSGGGAEVTSEQSAIITRQSGHMAKLVDDLLDVARVTSGKITLDRRPLDLREIARRSLQVVCPPAGPQRHRVTLETSADPVGVDGDAVRLEQVATNLLSNAIRYTPEGGQVRVAVRPEGADAVLRVADDGSGIPAEMLGRIFEPFVQTEQPLARTQGGLGVGLTLVRSLVRMHGGDVTVASGGPGRGSEFTVRLPLASGVKVAVPEAREATNGPPRHVLLVEDSPDVRRGMERLLKMWGHRVVVAPDGVRAVERAVADRPDVALVDVGLPDIDGYEVARRVRAATGGGDIYLIALTGYGQPEDRRLAEEAGFDRHLVKPVPPKELRLILADPATVRTRRGPGR